MAERRLISFDWALKNLLKNKANFEVLEGFLSELLKDDVKIEEILESESNKDHEKDKYNRVDLKVKNIRDEIIIIELQYEREKDYLKRILYGASKAVSEHFNSGEPYSKISKVISISITYFDLGQGRDYIYKGSTKFFGINKKDELKLSDKQKEFYKAKSIDKIYPEYYIIKVRHFIDEIKDGLDEWIYFFKEEKIKDEFKAKGLKKAKEVLDIMKLSEKERQAYFIYMEDLSYQASMFESSYGDGKFDGFKEGMEKGKAEMAKGMKKKGIDIDTISDISGLSPKDIEAL